jgi:thioredoxin 1
MEYLSCWRKTKEVDTLAIELNRENYDVEVLESQKPVLVDFWGPQCMPCLALMPVVDQIEKVYDGRLKVAKLDASTNRMLCAKLRVLSLPTFILYKDGTEVARLTGDNINEHDLTQAVMGLIPS